MTSFMLLSFENLKFCETEYRLSSLQVSNLLVVWIEFYGRGWKRLQRDKKAQRFI